MVSQGVITAMLSVAVIMGAVPIVGGSILLAMRKIKGSAFWSGVGIAFISSLIMIFVQTFISADSLSDDIYALTVQLAAAVANIALIVIFFEYVIKRSVNFNGAVSLGLGFGAVNLLSYAFTVFGNYMMAYMINNGTFDQAYSASVEAGAIDRQTVVMLKQSIINIKATEIIMYIPNCIGFILMITAASIFIVYGINNKKLISNLLLAFGLHAAISVISGLVSNIYAAAGLIFVIPLAAFIYALNIRHDVEVPAVLQEKDSFLETVSNVKNIKNENE